MVETKEILASLDEVKFIQYLMLKECSEMLNLGSIPLLGICRACMNLQLFWFLPHGQVTSHGNHGHSL